MLYFILDDFFKDLIDLKIPLSPSTGGLPAPPSLPPPGQVLTCAVRSCACPCPIGRAVPSHEPRGLVAFPAGIDDRAGEEDPITAEDHPIGRGAWVSAGHGCQEAKTVVAHKGVSQD